LKNKKQITKPRKNVAFSLPASELSPPPNLAEELWPAAVPQNLIVTDQGKVEKQFRALHICSIIKRFNLNYENKRVLDLGCGEGHTTIEIADKAKFVVGYDILSSNWEANWNEPLPNHNDVNYKFTSDNLVVEGQEKFDLIVLFDVLDHTTGMEPPELLEWAKSLLNPDGQIFIHFHPWSSRSGGHYYDTINKAYAHLVFTPDELIQLGFSVTDSRSTVNKRIVKPLATYHRWIEKAGLEIISKLTNSSDVDPFFESLLPRMNQVSWGGQCDLETITQILKIDSINYVVKHAAELPIED